MYIVILLYILQSVPWATSPKPLSKCTIPNCKETPVLFSYWQSLYGTDWFSVKKKCQQALFGHLCLDIFITCFPLHDKKQNHSGLTIPRIHHGFFCSKHWGQTDWYIKTWYISHACMHRYRDTRQVPNWREVS